MNRQRSRRTAGRVAMAGVLGLAINGAIFAGLAVLNHAPAYEAPRDLDLRVVHMEVTPQPEPPPPTAVSEARDKPPETLREPVPLPPLEPLEVTMADVPGVSVSAEVAEVAVPAPAPRQTSQPAASPPGPARPASPTGPVAAGDADRPPRGKQTPEPHYPAVARRMGAEGWVQVQLLIGEDGRVRKVEVLDAAGHDAFTRAARQAVRQWRFRPARHEGRAVAVVGTHTLHFQLEGR